MYYQTRRGSQAPNARWQSDDEARDARQRIRERRQKGDTYQRIADDEGVSINTVRKVEKGISYPEDS